MLLHSVLGCAGLESDGVMRASVQRSEDRLENHPAIGEESHKEAKHAA